MIPLGRKDFEKQRSRKQTLAGGLSWALLGKSFFGQDRKSTPICSGFDKNDLLDEGRISSALEMRWVISSGEKRRGKL